MLKLIKMTVNGKEVETAVDPRESLLVTLRNRLGLTSVKRGCEVGECGACTVLVDGEAIDSCIYLAVWAEGKTVLTVEGLRGPNGELSPIQQAFIEEAAVQCGFCTPGLIMTAVEIVGSGKRYTREELRKQISGHLCRCTGYQNILNAMERIVNETYKAVGQDGPAGRTETGETWRGYNKKYRARRSSPRAGAVSAGAGPAVFSNHVASRGLIKTPDLPPLFWARWISPISMARSMALHMS